MSATFQPVLQTATLPRPQSHPLRRLFVTATAGIIALSMIAASALPARAEMRRDDVAKALIAAIAIGAIVHAIDKKKERERAARTPAPAPAPPPAPVHGTWAPRIPAICAIEIIGRDRSAVVYPETCLRREGVVARLPVQCRSEARIYGRIDRIYSETCLRSAGFVIVGNPHYLHGSSGHGPDRHGNRGWYADR